MIAGWTGKTESIDLRFGSEYHAALEFYDRQAALGERDHEVRLRSTIRRLMDSIWNWEPDLETKAGHYKNHNTLISLVVDYLDHFNPDPCKTYIKSDGDPAVELSFRFELDWGPAEGRGLMDDGQPYLLCGHLDRVVEFNDQLLVMDRKTTKTTIGPYYFAQYSPNNQMSLYILAGRILLNAPIRGVIIDAAQIKLEEPNAFARGFTYRTDDQIEEWLADLRTTLSLAETYAINNHWPMNDTACDKFGGCKFREVCSKSPAVRERFLAADFIKLPEDRRWNPLKSR